MTCTFFGHRTVHEKIEPTLRSTLIDLIVNHGVNLFYVGNQGAFDSMVRKVLKELSTEYPITYLLGFKVYVIDRAEQIEKIICEIGGDDE